MTRNELFQVYVTPPVEASSMPMSSYDADGLDLYVDDPEKSITDIGRRLVAMEKMKDAGTLAKKDVDPWLQSDAENVCLTLRAFLDQIKVEHPLYVSAVQNWARDEYRVRKIDDDHSSPEDRHLQLIEVLSDIQADLLADGEDPDLIHITDLWREEEFAAFCAVRAREVYRQAA